MKDEDATALNKAVQNKNMQFFQRGFLALFFATFFFTLSGSSVSAAGCQGLSAYNPCTTESGQAGSCRADDDEGTGALECRPTLAPGGTLGGGGGAPGGIGAACKSDSYYSNTGTCQSATSPTPCKYGTTSSVNCAAPLLCCIDNNGSTSGGGGGGSTTPDVSGKCPDGFSGRGSVCFPTGTGLSSIPIAVLLRNIMNWLLLIFGSLAIIAFVISGIQYLVAAGDEGMMEIGKRNMKYSIFGVIIALAGLVIVKAIDMALLGSPIF